MTQVKAVNQYSREERRYNNKFKLQNVVKGMGMLCRASSQSSRLQENTLSTILSVMVLVVL